MPKVCNTNFFGLISNEDDNLNNGNNDDLTEWENSLKCVLNNRIRSLQDSYNLKYFEFWINFGLLNKQIDNIHKHYR